MDGDENQNPKNAVCIDMGRYKRGIGRHYDSTSGHGIIIGKQLKIQSYQITDANTHGKKIMEETLIRKITT